VKINLGWRKERGAVEKRRGQRIGLNLGAIVRQCGRSAVSATVTDISAFGCKLKAGSPLIRGSDLWLKLPSLENVLATVTWSNDENAGIAFDRPLASNVTSMLERGTADSARLPRSRMEQIRRGVAGSQDLPLTSSKSPKGQDMTQMIARHTVRSADHRTEMRYTDAIPEEPMPLKISSRGAVLADVSASGLKAEAELDEEIGEAVDVRFGDLPQIEGRIVWRKNGQVGLSLPPESIELHQNQ
jgi:hypothetical protein